MEAPNIPLGGTLVLARGSRRTAYPLQPAGRTDWTYVNGAALGIGAGGLALTNLGAAAANVEILALDPDGYVLGRSSITVGANAKWSGLISEVLTAEDLGPGGMLALRSTSPIHGVFFAGAARGLLRSGRVRIPSSGTREAGLSAACHPLGLARADPAGR